MAFPVPSHLPRKYVSEDISSNILSRISETSSKELNAGRAASWVAELDESIRHTKEQIYEEIHANFPQLNDQLTASNRIQTRLHSLASEVDSLTQNLSHKETGLVSTLVNALTVHATLAQESHDADILFDFLSYLSQIHVEFTSMETSIEHGNLPAGIQISSKLEDILRRMPEALEHTNIMLDFERTFRTLKARTEEQLSLAYSQCVQLSYPTLTILPSVIATSTNTALSLSAILATLPADALSNHLFTFRRDIATQFIDEILKDGPEVSMSAETSSLSCSTTKFTPLAQRLDSVAQVLTFLSQRLFFVLPSSQSQIFPLSLCKHINTSILNNFLIPSLPTDLASLPEFLRILHSAVDFEEQYVIKLLGNDRHDRPIQVWANSVGSHYEHKRRLYILDNARQVILSEEDETEAFMVEVDALHQPEPESEPKVIAVQGDIPIDDAWDLEDTQVESIADDSVEDAWGLDDDAGVSGSGETNVEPDPDDAWGWNESEEPIPEIQPEENAWNDPWDTAANDTDTAPAPVSPPSSIPSPKVATRLEKIANKGKREFNGLSAHTPLHSPVTSSPLVHSSTTIPSLRVSTQPSRLPPAYIPKETYLVSAPMSEILSMVSDVLQEGNKFAASKIITTKNTEPAPGTILLQTAVSIFDLYLALYPIVFSSIMGSPQGPIRFSNNCLFLALELERLENENSQIKDQLTECKERLKTVSEIWSLDTINNKQQSIVDTLVDGTKGFTSIGDQGCYDDCEGTFGEVLQDIRKTAKQWKSVMPKSKYYTAIGSVVNAALSQILGDVLALPDIPESDSKRISELCRILHALEGLFVEDSSQPSFVVSYVPMWLKYSYLSELLEATMVDITYLFENGALVDYKVEELANLVRALFADTSSRANLVNKIMVGSPSTQS